MLGIMQLHVYTTEKTIRASVDALCRDGADERGHHLSRKNLLTQPERRGVASIGAEEALASSVLETL